MKVLFAVAFLVVLGIAIFAVQNSNAPLVAIRLLFWRFETSLIYAVLGSILLGICFVLLFWIPWAIRASIRKRRHSSSSPSYTSS